MILMEMFLLILWIETQGIILLILLITFSNYTQVRSNLRHYAISMNNKLTILYRMKLQMIELQKKHRIFLLLKLIALRRLIYKILHFKMLFKHRK